MLLALVSSMFGCSVNSLWYSIIGQTKSCIYGYTHILQLSLHVGPCARTAHTCGCTVLQTEVHKIPELKAT